MNRAVLLGFIPVTVFSWAGIAAGVPTIISPFNILLIFPPLLLPEPMEKLIVLDPVVMIAIMWGIVYVVWTLFAAKAAPRIPKSSRYLFIGASVLSAIYLSLGFDAGTKNQGIVHTLWVIAANAVLIFILYYFLDKEQKFSSSRSFIIFHIVLFSWLGWGAFPWLGEGT